MAQSSTRVDNVQRIREGYEAFGRGDLEYLRAQFSPDIVWHIPGKSPIAGDYKGIDAVFGLFMKIFEETGGTLKNDVHDVLANDTHGIALITQSGERKGKKLSGNVVQVTHQDGAGLLTESWFLPEDAAASDDFWS